MMMDAGFAATLVSGICAARAIGGSLVLAYLDPGTGSFVLQFLIAGLLTGLLAARQWAGQVRSAVGWAFRRNG